MGIAGIDFEKVKGYIVKHAGIDLPETNYKSMGVFIEERLAELGCDINAYLYRLSHDRGEYSRFFDAVTINETYFFRESRQFKVLEQSVFPDLLKRQGEKVYFWSAACSTGEEAISLAALGKTYFSSHVGKDIEVYASDLSDVVLEIFKKGEYSVNSFREDGREYHSILDNYKERHSHAWVLGEDLKRSIHIKHKNLFDDDFNGFPDQFNIVFLRNTLIYLSQDVRSNIIDMIVSRLAEEGYLFLSATEMPLISHQDLCLLEREGVYYFQKISFQEKQQGFVVNSVLGNVINEKPLIRSREERKKVFLDILKIEEYANKKIHNRLFSIENDINYDIAMQYLRAVYMINLNKVELAKKLLSELEEYARENEFYHYFKGYIEMMEEQPDKAVACFEKALEYQVAFWPAKYYIGMQLRGSEPMKARRYLKMCKQNIISYLEGNSFKYQFLLDGFNARYFLDITEKWLSKLEADSVGRGV